MLPPRLAFDSAPSDWRHLQACVAQFFQEMGCETAIEEHLTLPRGSVTVDVVVRDPVLSPPASYLIECKHWKRRVPKAVVHAFRTVVTEAGAERGFIVSTAGFQAGAREAAISTNIQLISWRELQTLFFDRWLETSTGPFHAMARRLNLMLAYPEDDGSDNSMWKGRDCSEDAWAELETLRTKYAAISTWALVHEGVPIPMYLEYALEIALTGAPPRFRSYRELVDWFPVLYEHADLDLQNFLQKRTRADA